MDSKRRMVEIHIWDQPFFSELSQTEKLFYWLVVCKCDNVGVYQHNPKLAAFHCEGSIDLQVFLDKVNFDQERIATMNNGSVWIKDFVRDTWGTLAAGNNLGRSCYKLLHKHGLLERFISEYPNCIKIKSFRDAITEGRLDLPLPQGSPSPDPEKEVSSEYEGQASPRPATINNNINRSINDSTNISIKPTSSLYYHNIGKAIKKIFPEWVLNGVSDKELENDLTAMVESIGSNDIDKPRAFIIAKAKNTDWESTEWKDFKQTIINGALKEVPF